MQARLARRMAQHDPAARPSCVKLLADLLRAELWRQPEPRQLESVVAELHTQLEATEVALRARETEVVMLRRLLSDNGVPHRHIVP